MQQVAHQREFSVHMPVHRARERPGEVQPPQRIKHASTPEPSRGRDGVAQVNTTHFGVKRQGQPHRQTQSAWAELPHDPFARHRLHHLTDHPHARLRPDVLIHEHNVADVIVARAMLEHVQFEMRARPP